MTLKSSFIRKGFLLFAFFMNVALLWGHPKKSNNALSLSKVLENAASYCEKVKKMAFDFVCEERINEKLYHYEVVRGYRRKGADLMIPVIGFKLNQVEENSYIYDYQMVKKGGKTLEKRTLIRKNDKEINQEETDFSIKGFSAKYLVYGPVGFLSKYWQNHFNYQILGQDKIAGEVTLVLSAIPKYPRKINNYKGTIWIKVNDFSITKIKWEPLDEKDKKLSSPLGNLEKEIHWFTEYGVEKNGVKFPSKQIIEEYFVPLIIEEHPMKITRKGLKQLKYKASYHYTNYKFFTVEVDVEIKQLSKKTMPGILKQLNYY